MVCPCISTLLIEPKRLCLWEPWHSTFSVCFCLMRGSSCTVLHLSSESENSLHSHFVLQACCLNCFISETGKLRARALLELDLGPLLKLAAPEWISAAADLWLLSHFILFLIHMPAYLSQLFIYERTFLALEIQMFSKIGVAFVLTQTACEAKRRTCVT